MNVAEFAQRHGIEIPCQLPEDVLALPVVWNSRLRTSLGRAMFRDGVPTRIEMNPRLKRPGEEAARRLPITFLHEVAHAWAFLGGHFGHGLPWKTKMARLGQVAERCYSREVGAALGIKKTRRARRVVARCGKCGYTLERVKALPRGRIYGHRGCGGRFEPC